MTLAIAISLLEEEFLWQCQLEEVRDEDASLPKTWGKARGVVFMNHTSRCLQGRAHDESHHGKQLQGDSSALLGSG